MSTDQDINVLREMVSPSTNIHSAEAIANAAIAPTDDSPEHFSVLLEALTILCQEFSESVLTSRSRDCVAAHYAKFRGSSIIKELIPYSLSSRRANYKVGKAFRQGLEKVYAESWALSSGYRKPYGNPGDFDLLESVYDCVPHPNTKSAIGQIIDVWALGTDLARSVVDRKNALRLFIEEFSNVYKTSGARAKVLSIAAGSARELRELPIDTLENLDITLLDIDERGINFSKAFFDTRHIPLSVETVVANALSLDTIPLLKEKGLNDLVYAFGLYDYLNDEQLLQSIAIGKEAMKHDGTFVFSLKDHRHYDSRFCDWVMNWRFFPRITDDGFILADKAGLTVEDTYMTQGGAVTLYICKNK